MIALLQASTGTDLQHLDLSSNGLGAEAAKLLAQAVASKDCTLKVCMWSTFCSFF